MSKEQIIIEYLKKFEVNVEIDKIIAQALISSLSPEGLETLGDGAKDRFVQYYADKSLVEHTHKKKRNVPLSELLAKYKDKKSGMVSESMEELYRCFPSLDFDDQCVVLSAFLDGPEKDHARICQYLASGHWDDGYADIVERAWLNDPESRLLSEIVLMYASFSFVWEHKDSLRYSSESLLAARLCEAGIMPEIEKWGTINYLAIRCYANKFVGEDEARALVMQYLVSAAKYSIEHCRIPDYARRIPEELPSLCYLDGVRSLIFYLGKMQLVSVVEWFNKLDSGFCREFNRSGGLDYPSDNSRMSPDQWATCLWKRYCTKFIEIYDNPEYKTVKIQLSDDIPFVNSGNPDHIDSIDKAFLAEV